MHLGALRPAAGLLLLLVALAPAASTYDYSLRDQNPSSATFGGNVGPSSFQAEFPNGVTMHYFGHQS
jgi:hypothetical protein